MWSSGRFSNPMTTQTSPACWCTSACWRAEALFRSSLDLFCQFQIALCCAITLHYGTWCKIRFWWTPWSLTETQPYPCSGSLLYLPSHSCEIATQQSCSVLASFPSWFRPQYSEAAAPRQLFCQQIPAGSRRDFFRVCPFFDRPCSRQSYWIDLPVHHLWIICWTQFCLPAHRCWIYFLTVLWIWTGGASKGSWRSFHFGFYQASQLQRF